jgi:hypothetical protein
MKHRLPIACRARAAIRCPLPKIIILNDLLSAGEHNNLGKIYESWGRNDLAAQQSRSALIQDPGSVSSFFMLATSALSANVLVITAPPYEGVFCEQGGDLRMLHGGQSEGTGGHEEGYLHRVHRSHP